MGRLATNRNGGSGIECLAVNASMVHALQMRAEGIRRANNVDGILASVKCCPTRHGCTGATNCDSCVGDYRYGR